MPSSQTPVGNRYGLDDKPKNRRRRCNAKSPADDGRLRKSIIQVRTDAALLDRPAHQPDLFPSCFHLAFLNFCLENIPRSRHDPKILSVR